VDFFSFFGSVRFASAQQASSPPFPPRCRLSFDRRRHTTVLCHVFLLSQEDLAASASSSSNAWCCRLPSRVKTEALNPHHRGRLPSLDRSTPTLHCYKRIISTLVTLSTTQPRLYFASSLARAPRHRSSTRRRCSLSPLSYVHHPFAQ
jgi:hypothetical protein